MTTQVDDLHRRKVELAAAHATAAPYVRTPTRGTVRLRSVPPTFDTVAESATGRLTLVGEFDLACGERFRNASAAILAGGAAEVVVDLARLHFIDTSGIDILIEFEEALAMRGATLRAINADAWVGRVFSICGLNTMLTVRPAPYPDDGLT
jgi:anti-anti-sigma factor